jgi:hypothetical protein
MDERYVGREVSDILQITRRDIFKGFIWAEQRYLLREFQTLLVGGDCLCEVFLEGGTVWLVRRRQLLPRALGLREKCT